MLMVCYDIRSGSHYNFLWWFYCLFVFSAVKHINKSKNTKLQTHLRHIPFVFLLIKNPLLELNAAVIIWNVWLNDHRVFWNRCKWSERVYIYKCHKFSFSICFKNHHLTDWLSSSAAQPSYLFWWNTHPANV